MSIVLLGLNHRSAPVEIRERVAVPLEEKSEVCGALLDNQVVSEAVVLSTCNRTEIFLSAENSTLAVELARKVFAMRCPRDQTEKLNSSLYEKVDSVAVRHLFEVATSLDSLVIGEPHILGQVRDDYETARQTGTVGKVLGRLFLRSLELGKAVRKQTVIGESPVSVSSIALDMAARVFGTIEGRTVLVLGAGEMGRQTAILARHRGAGRIVVTNRTMKTAKQLSDRVKGQVYAWEEREKAMAESDVIITSTAALEPIIRKEEMSTVMQIRRNRPIFIIDIAVPRDVDPSVDALHNLYRYDLDDLTDIARENEARRQVAVPAVREMIEEARHDYEAWREQLSVIPTIVRLRDHVESIRESEVEAHLRKLHSIDDRDRNIVEALSHAIVNKVLHIPTVRLKEAVAYGTEQRHAGSVRFLFDLKSDEKDEGDDE